MAKKKTTRKKTSAARSKRPPAKNSSGGSSRTHSKKKSSASKKKAVSKKAPAMKKVPAKKKVAAKKAAVKSRGAKKAPAKKPAPKKAAAKKKAPAKKKVVAKSVSKKKVSAKLSKTSKSAKGKSSASKNEQPVGPTLTDARAAAAKLAAMAGLPTLKQRTLPTQEQEDNRPKLTKTPFNKRQLDKYRYVLIDKRKQVLGDVTDMEDEALGRSGAELSSMPQDVVDQGSDEYDQTLALGLAASQRMLLAEIDDAIVRIDKRTYGICEMMGVPIMPERLEATPWARYSVEGARRSDSGRYSS